MRRALTRLALVAVLGAAAGSAALAPPASAFNPLDPICGIAGAASGAAGKVCSVARNGGRLLSAGKKLLTGHVGSAIKAFLGGGTGGVSSKVTTALALAAIGTWVLGGARFALTQTAHVLGQTTAPRLTSTWFSATYWQVAGVSALLTLPFLFAAGVQALLASDLALVLRAAFGYLPLAMLGVGIAAPATMLLLSASDQLSAVVSSAAGHAGAQFLQRAALATGIVTGVSGSPFLAFFAGLLTVGVTVALWLELLARGVAVYVIVLLLPLGFAAFVWPARRMWLVRGLEILVALILAKFVIVAVLSLGGAALAHSFPLGVTGTIAGVALLGLAACAPWAVLRLLPITELATTATHSLRGEIEALGTRAAGAQATASEVGRPAEALTVSDDGWIPAATAAMRREHDATQAEDAGPSTLAAAHASAGSHPGAAPSASEPPPGPSQVPSPSEVPSGSSDAAGAENPSSAPAAGHPSHRRERSPGLEAMWQAEDFSWQTLTFGPDADWPPRVWPHEGEAGESPARHEHDESDSPPAPSGDEAIPPPQPPPEGSL